MFSKLKETKGVVQTHYLKLNCTVLSLFHPSKMLNIFRLQNTMLGRTSKTQTLK